MLFCRVAARRADISPTDSTNKTDKKSVFSCTVLCDETRQKSTETALPPRLAKSTFKSIIPYFLVQLGKNKKRPLCFAFVTKSVVYIKHTALPKRVAKLTTAQDILQPGVR